MDDLRSLGAIDPALHSVVLDYLHRDGADLVARWDRHQRFWDARASTDLDPYSRSNLDRTGPVGRVQLITGETRSGVNFASQDYLSLSAHPAVLEAAQDAIGRWGVHSAGSVALQGGSVPLLALQDQLAEMLRCEDVAVFPTGWGAGYGAIRTLVREEDHIIIDSLAHACLQEGAVNATRNLHRVPHLSNAAVERRLRRIRGADSTAGILVVTETLFSMDSDVPDLRGLRALCDQYGATLLVDVAHDLGAIGDGGLGFLAEQGLVGQVDVVVGAFSKTFAANGGFVASARRGLKQALRAFAGPLTFSNALSPLQAAIVLAALRVVRSPEGATLRSRLMRNVMRLRGGLEAAGFAVLGQPSAIVPVAVGTLAEARLATRAMLEGGALVNLVEYPAVPRHDGRWRLQVMADHDAWHVDELVRLAAETRKAAKAG